MSSIFDGLSIETPSIIVDRVHETQLAHGDADFLAFFPDPGGTAGGGIAILQRPDPVFEPSDFLPGLQIWGLSQDRALEIGGAHFLFGVGWRMVYPEAPRFRETGEPDAGALVWKFRRALLQNIPLTNGVGQDPQADRIEAFRAVVFQGLEFPGDVCVDVIEGSVTYEKLIDKDDV